MERHEAKGTETLDEQRQNAAAGLGDIAGALHRTAQDLDGKYRSGVAQMAERAADGMDRLSTTLRRKDVNQLLRDTESFARSQPALFVGAAVAAGFLAMRFLKSSDVHDDSAVHGEGSAPLRPSASPEPHASDAASPSLQSERRL